MTRWFGKTMHIVAFSLGGIALLVMPFSANVAVCIAFVALLWIVINVVVGLAMDRL